MTYRIAQLAVETGISPRELLALDRKMLNMIIQVFHDKAEAVENARSSKRAR